MSLQQNKEVGKININISLMEMEEKSKQLNKDKQDLAELKVLMNEDVITTEAMKDGTTEQNFAKLIASLKTTMSDHGPINPSFNRELKTMREDLLPVAIENWHNLSEDSKAQIGSMSNFYCKMHLIVNLEEEAKKALKTFEQIIIQETYLDNYGLKNLMISFIGNRVNILCYNTAAVYYHHHHIVDLIQSLPNPNQLLKAIVADAQEKAYLAGVRALGIIGKTVTGPFWRLLSRSGSNILSLNDHLLNMMIHFERWSKDASSLLEGETLFNEDLVERHKDLLYEDLF
ncbi:hypothetical protein SKAU_G00235430 [Synaphobranchus kaupii]|uniref:Uncharacterized protein n=1 Tax=Synaphobranchus kaupii TaxID=118154 RepID=A0A9Q1F6F0_SYNKA|nr:hypothetical protein SKAU_G00235430 [Synaphobranchus kaupii]